MRIDSPKVVSISVADSPYAASATPGAPELLILANCTGGNVTINLPTAVGNVTKYIVQKTDASANTLTIDPAGSETIAGDSTLVIEFQNSTALIVPGGGKYNVI